MALCFSYRPNHKQPVAMAAQVPPLHTADASNAVRDIARPMQAARAAAPMRQRTSGVSCMDLLTAF